MSQLRRKCVQETLDPQTANPTRELPTPPSCNSGIFFARMRNTLMFGTLMFGCLCHCFARAAKASRRSQASQALTATRLAEEASDAMADTSGRQQAPEAAQAQQPHWCPSSWPRGPQTTTQAAWAQHPTQAAQAQQPTQAAQAQQTTWAAWAA